MVCMCAQSSHPVCASMALHVKLFQSCPTLCDPMDCSPSLSMGFPRQEYWSGLPFPPPGDLPDTGIELMSFVSYALAGKFFTKSSSGKPP